MGLRFRKSFKIAPGVRLNLNRKSVGVSLGGKGARYSINSSGRRTATVSVPGTGISYSKTTAGKSSSGKSAPGTSERYRGKSVKNSAVSGGGSWNLAFIIADEGKHFFHQRNNIPGFVISRQEEIKTGTAAHGAEIQNLLTEVRVVPEKSSAEMFNGVNFGSVHHRLEIRAGHAEIKGGDHGVFRLVLAGYIYAWKQSQVINGKTGNLFHRIPSFLY